MFFMTRTMAKNVRIAIVAAETFTFWKMDFKHVLHDQNIVKNRKDQHRSRRDIHILKNGFQTHSPWPEYVKDRKDHHCSRRDIHILKNGFQTHSPWPEHVKNLKDHHRSRRDIHILKTHSPWPELWQVNLGHVDVHETHGAVGIPKTLHEF